MTQYVLGFMFNPAKTKVVLIKKTKPDWQKGKLNGVGGKIEKDELPDVAMVREFKEETWVKTKPNDWYLFTILTDVSKTYEVFCFTASKRTFINCSTATDEIVAIYDVNELPNLENLLTNIISLVFAAKDSNHYFTRSIYMV